MDSEKLFEKLVNNEISREEFEALLEKIDDDQLRAKYDEYLYSLFMEAVKAHSSEITDSPKKDEPKNNYRKYYSIAATLLIISSITFYLIMISPEYAIQAPQQTSSSETSQLEIKNTPTRRMFRTRLDDGSFVHLNAVSSISYPKKFGSDKREVEVAGEAYFDVSRDETRPFLITVKDFKVEVLGTSFNIRAYEDDDIFSVVVETGSVKVMLNESKDGTIILEKNQKISYSASDGKYVITKVKPELELSWRQGILRFDSTPMMEVEKMLERWYGVEVLVQDSSIYQKSITGIHQNENIRSILESLTYATGTKYSFRNNTIIIKN